MAGDSGARGQEGSEPGVRRARWHGRKGAGEPDGSCWRWWGQEGGGAGWPDGRGSRGREPDRVG